MRRIRGAHAAVSSKSQIAHVWKMKFSRVEERSMSKRLLAVFVVLLIAGGFSILAANGTYVIKDKWYGFVTDVKDVRKGESITAAEVRKSVADGSKYAMINDIYAHAYILVSPPEKIAPFAAQSVWVYGAITTHSLLKGNRVVADSDGGGAGEGSSRDDPNFTIVISSVTPDKK
jgi:hypothetical protein